MLTRYISQLVDQFLFHNNFTVSLICLLPAIVSYITLSTCYKTAFYYNRFPDWATTPWISFAGVNKPESNIFAVGLTIAGITLLCVNHIFTTKLMNDKRIIDINHFNFYFNDIKTYLLTNSYISNQYFIKYLNITIEWILSYNLIIASIAVTIQAWINVGNDMLVTFLSPKMQTMQWYPDYNAVIHIGCASIFFFGCILYHNICVVLTFNHRHNTLLKYSFYYKLLTLGIGCIAGLGCFWNILYASYIVDPYTQQESFYFAVNGIGFCQCVATMCDCLFWISFAVDYYVITTHYTSKNK